VQGRKTILYFYKIPGASLKSNLHFSGKIFWNNKIRRTFLGSGININFGDLSNINGKRVSYINEWLNFETFNNSKTSNYRQIDEKRRPGNN
jgi:hypothetical protein